MKTETLEYRDGEVNLRGFLAFDDEKSGKRPGVLVMPEAFGLGAQAKRRAQMLSDMGYVALGGDPYGDGLELDNLQDAVTRATAIFADPTLPVRLVDELSAECRLRGLGSYRPLIGTALPARTGASSAKGVEYRP